MRIMGGDLKGEEGGGHMQGNEDLEGDPREGG